jgi:TIR domain
LACRGRASLWVSGASKINEIYMYKEGIKVFLSYSSKDQALVDQFTAHLTALKWRGVIQSWNDHQIEAGTDWAGAITSYLDSADIILLLLSSDFLASEYSLDEAHRALNRKESGQAQVIPVLLRPVDFSATPFSISNLQASPSGGKPITLWEDKDAAFLSVARDIRKVAEELKARAILDA